MLDVSDEFVMKDVSRPPLIVRLFHLLRYDLTQAA